MKQQLYQSVDKYDYTKQDLEKNGEISKTIPDQSYSLREIMQKFTRGQSITGMGTYNDSDYGRGHTIENWQQELQEGAKPNPSTMDLTERKEYAKQAKNEINKLEEKHKQKQNEKQRKAEETKNNDTTSTESH